MSQGMDESPGWLLKMHGCVTRPDEIVLSRDDYMSYDRARSALGGMVQAMLMTKHMLFVGFSLVSLWLTKQVEGNLHRCISDGLQFPPHDQRCSLGS